MIVASVLQVRRDGVCEVGLAQCLQDSAKTAQHTAAAGIGHCLFLQCICPPALLQQLTAKVHQPYKQLFMPKTMHTHRLSHSRPLVQLLPWSWSLRPTSSSMMLNSSSNCTGLVRYRVRKRCSKTAVLSKHQLGKAEKHSNCCSYCCCQAFSVRAAWLLSPLYCLRCHSLPVQIQNQTALQHERPQVRNSNCLLAAAANSAPSAAPITGTTS
jgi:hypothetical protein